MKPLMLIALILLLAVIAFFVLWKRKQQGAIEPTIEEEQGPTYSKKKLMTAVEQTLYYRLRQALPKHNVMSQVSMSALVSVKGEGSMSARGKFAQKYADFVICTPAFDVVAVIELDDKSHDTERAKEKDGKKDFALTKAGHKVIRWRQKEIPSVEDITAIFSTEQSHPKTP